MIQSYLTGPVALSSNSSPISFETDCIRTRSASCCGWLQHTQGLPLYKILEGGNYNVSFNANVTSATAGTVALGLFMDGILIPGTTMIAEVATAGDYYNISFDKVVPVCCRSNSTLTIASIPSVLTGTDPEPTETEVPTIQTANLIISRRC